MDTQMSRYPLAVIIEYKPDCEALAALLAPYEEDAAPEYMTEHIEGDLFDDGGYYVNPDARFDWW